MLKTVTKEIQSFIPSKEKNDKQPTTIFYIPLSKGKYDSYMDKLTEVKKNKVISKFDQASRILFELCLAPNPAKGNAYILNAMIDGKPIDMITDKAQAIDYLLGLEDIESANEIVDRLRGSFSLTEDEEKNSDGQ